MIRTNLVRGAIALGLVASPLAAWTDAGAATANPGYTLTPWASGNISGCDGAFDASSTCYFNPDSLTKSDTAVYAGFQNHGAADGSTGSSEVVRFDLNGNANAFYGPFNGKTDGLRIDPSTGLLWVLNNEDANPVLRIIDPATSATQTFVLPTANGFAGGYDDAAFTANGTFLSASNPAGTATGFNNYRSVVRIQFINGDVVLTPILPGHVVATDRSTGAQVNVNLTDPDSLSTIPGSNTIVLNDQGDSVQVFIENAGTEQQQVSVLFLQPKGTLAPVVDETTWTQTPSSSGGAFLVANHSNPGAIYSLTKPGGYATGATYTTVSNDNPAAPSAKTVGLLDTTSGSVTPVAGGFSSPKGLLFVP